MLTLLDQEFFYYTNAMYQCMKITFLVHKYIYTLKIVYHLSKFMSLSKPIIHF